MRFDVSPSFEYGRLDPLETLHQLTAIYKCLADNKVEGGQKRAENAIHFMVKSQMDPHFIDCLPVGIAAPLREAVRTCQLSPPGDWPLAAYRAIKRNDLAACASDAPDILFNDGYRSVKDYIVYPSYTLLYADR
jgi:anaphase-promoting complex subunit 1